MFNASLSHYRKDFHLKKCYFHLNDFINKETLIIIKEFSKIFFWFCLGLQGSIAKQFLHLASIELCSHVFNFSIMTHRDTSCNKADLNFQFTSSQFFWTPESSRDCYAKTLNYSQNSVHQVSAFNLVPIQLRLNRAYWQHFPNFFHPVCFLIYIKIITREELNLHENLHFNIFPLSLSRNFTRCWCIRTIAWSTLKRC